MDIKHIHSVCCNSTNHTLCIHWYTENDIDYQLEYGYKLYQHMNPDLNHKLVEHLALTTKTLDRQQIFGDADILPTDTYTETERIFANLNKPQNIEQNKLDIHTEIFEENSLKQQLINGINNNCSSIYLCNNQLTIVKTYLFVLLGVDEFQKEQYENIKQELVKNINCLLQDIFNGLIVCLSYDNHRYVDEYSKKID